MHQNMGACQEEIICFDDIVEAPKSQVSLPEFSSRFRVAETRRNHLYHFLVFLLLLGGNLLSTLGFLCGRDVWEETGHLFGRGTSDMERC